MSDQLAWRATAEMLLPARRPPPPPTEQSDAGVSSQKEHHGARVLIVEDEYFIAFVAEDALVDAGYAVVGQAVTAEAALQMAELHRPDIVVMDIRLMGAKDGIDAAEEIFARLGICSLFASAHVDTATRSRGEATRACVGWLAKPYSTKQLEAAVGTALAEAKRRSALS